MCVEALEIGCHVAAHELEDFQLKVKETGAMRKFNVIKEDKLMKALDHFNRVSKYDMNKLEVEYDYDTETE